MKLRFKRKHQEVNDIWSFFFGLVEPVEWQAGQSIRLEIPRPAWGVDERRFTIASAPFEKHIRITTRLSDSSFKQGLARLKAGDEINGFNIEGDFIWHEDDMPRLMLAAGIGITPTRSLLAQAIHDKKQLNTTLIYSSADKPALFSEELDSWQRQDPSLYVHYLHSERIGLDKDSSLAPFWLKNRIYVSGPEQMVQEVAESLVNMGIAKRQIMADLFTGL